MFQHLLVPTDGSALSRGTAQQAVRFAKSIDAKITAFHAMPELRLLANHPGLTPETRNSFVEQARAHADELLAFVKQTAQAEGVACQTVMVSSDHPHEAILRAALDRDCDLIFMASHGRRGIEGLLVGSETQKVMTHSKIPVLVWRAQEE
ncbi:MAG: universal stress protein [Giesbergeria sp.]|jgi:nucleotide-binding universal stress UspA family protein|nr:universal stress protein [Giesbergeria sp.]MBP6159257.1 universal stress protein [Giesbergeria sp.]MBP7083359.1 universal stress protein [Giesbergeria sp.]MBP9783662.1 universal stress protein [Giesbergeria sp.]